MAEPAVTVLLIEDNRGDARLIREALADAASIGAAGPAFELVVADSLAAGLERLAEGNVGAVLLDLSLPDSQGIETFVKVRARAPAVPLIVLSGLDDEDLAALAVREGAQDYLVKGQVDGPLLVRALRYAIERQRAEEERARLIREQVAHAQAQEAQLRLALLAEASRQLASSLDCQVILEKLARLVVPTLADWCVVDLYDEEHRLRRVVLAHADPTREALGRALEARYPAHRLPPGPIVEVLNTGRAHLLAPISEDLLGAVAVDAEHLQALRAPELRSAMIVPLVARGRVLGAITLLAAESGRQYGPADLALAEDLAGRTALAVDNALLYGEVQQQLRTRDEFLAAASHDLKNPLTSIKGVAQMLRGHLRRGGEVDLDRLATGLERIDTAAARMTAQIDELLDLTRLQMGGALELVREPVDLVALAEQEAAVCQQASEEHPISVEVTAAPVVGEWDRTRLERVLANLLGNAIKYSPAGAPITVEVRREEDASGAWAVLRVRDQGVGIPAADLPRVFERFQRAGNVIGRVPGTVVGLANARQIVEHHGGSISVTSQEGAGSTFTVRLPLAATPDPALVGTADPAPGRAPR